jgi:hypothetical protein
MRLQAVHTDRLLVAADLENEVFRLAVHYRVGAAIELGQRRPVVASSNIYV